MKRDYLSRLGRATRWYLPPAEAAEVLEDYRELIEAEPRSEDALLRDVGSPREAARRLAQPKVYRRWLAVFGILSVCLLLPGADAVVSGLSFTLYCLFRVYFLWEGIGNTAQFAVVLFPLGTVLAVAWFQRGGEKGETLPRGIVPLLTVPLLGMAWVWFLAWVVLAERFDVIGFLFPRLGRLVSATLALCILLEAAVGMFGLVKARLGDRRWRAVYVWGLTGAVLSIFLWSMLTSMTLDFSAGWQIPYILRIVSITAIGFMGTGVSLC